MNYFFVRIIGTNVQGLHIVGRDCEQFCSPVHYPLTMLAITPKILNVQSRFQKHHEATTDSKYSVIETKAIYTFSLLLICYCRVIICWNNSHFDLLRSHSSSRLSSSSILFYSSAVHQHLHESRNDLRRFSFLVKQIAGFKRPFMVLNMRKRWLRELYIK